MSKAKIEEVRYLIFLLIAFISFGGYGQIYPFEIMEGKVETVDGRVLSGTMMLEDGYKKVELSQSDEKKYIFQPSQLNKVEIRVLGEDEWQHMVVRKFKGASLLVRVISQNQKYSLFAVTNAYPVDDVQLDARRNAVFPVRRYVFKSEYYIQYLSGSLQRMSGTKGSWMKIVPGHEQEVDKFITTEQLDLANDAHLVRLMTFINTL